MTNIPSNVAWGHGAAKLVRPATKAATETVVFLSDLHVPYHDPEVVGAALNLIRDVAPDRVVLNGDLADFFQLSRFNTALERIDHLQEEVDAANAIRRAVREAAPDAVLDETVGNHDSRIVTYVQKNARALTSLRALDPASLFEYAELAITSHPEAGFLLRPEYLVKHGSIVRKGAGSTAKAELANAGISGISGHTHRLSTFRQAGYSPRQWTESGCMCLTSPDYVVGAPDWTQGIVIGEFSTKTNAYVTHEVPFLDCALRLGRERFTGTTATKRK
jgi:predicted phosphodiesterase